MKSFLKVLLLTLVFTAPAHALTGPFVQITTSTLQPGTTRGFWVSSGTATNFSASTITVPRILSPSGLTITANGADVANLTGTVAQFTTLLFDVNKSTPGEIGARVVNGNNVTGVSNSRISAITGGSNGGDPYIQWATQDTRSFGLGMDNSASDSLILYSGSATDAIPPSSGTAIMTVTGSSTSFHGTVSISSLTVISSATAPNQAVIYQQNKVIQVVYFDIATSSAVTSTSGYSNTTLTASITPTSASNRVYISVTSAVRIGGTSAGDNCAFNLRRGSTLLSTSDGYGVLTLQVSGVVNDTLVAINELDSPATTTATSYTFAMRNGNAGNTCTMNISNNLQSSITLTEVAP